MSKADNVFSGKSQYGDTIIEVLLCIAIVAFAVGVAYGLAGRSMQLGIAARERTEAVNLAQQQLEYMKRLKEQNSAALNTIKTGNTCTINTGGTISVRTNGSNPDNLAVGVGNYDGTCVYDNKYFFNIICLPAATGCSAADNSTFEVSTRWDRIGGGQDKSSLLYRP